MDSRSEPGPATLRHHDAVLGYLRRGGLSLELTAHAYAVVDSYVYGFSFEEATLPGGNAAEPAEAAEIAEIAESAEIADAMVTDGLADYPYLAEFTIEHVLKPGYHFGDSFEFGLDLIIDGLTTASKSAAQR